MRLSHLTSLTLAAALTWAGGCTSDGGGAATADVTPSDTVKVDVDAAGGPSDPTFSAALSATLIDAEAMTKEELFAKYLGDAVPAPTTLGYAPLDAAYLSNIDLALNLTPAEEGKLAQNGFVVSDRLAYPSFGEALMSVFSNDLPVLVTTDMILHALHRSYDDILKTIEEQVLIATLADVLGKTQQQLGAIALPTDPAGLAAYRDADLYLTVARSLLDGAPAASLTGGAVDQARDAFLGYVAGEQMTTVDIFGDARKMDFSQFKPRGHYTDSEELTRYFQAMMWLGRVDLRFIEQDPLTGEWLFHGRQLANALLLDQALRDAGGLAAWDRANDLITMLVGPVDYIDFRGAHRLFADHALTSADAAATLSGAALEALTADLLAGKYGEQQINSHWLETNPFSATPTPLPPSFAFLGQRFVVDSYVMANVVYDNVVHDGQKVQRVLPNPLDVLFVLGNDEVLPLLSDELDRYPYQGALHALRFLVDYYDDAFWASNIYNLWLSALRTLNTPTREAPFPPAMRTDAWRDKTAHTQLASWAQLRHDTLLYAKQSYTGGVSCEHPAGYVEPYPAFYESLRALAESAGHTLTNVDFPQAWVQQRLTQFFDGWESTMATLADMAQKELDGVPFTDAQVAFIKSTIQADGGCGEPVYSGWYPTLFFYEGVGEWKPTIADVHTNPNQGPLPGPNVLHVATADVDLMVFTADACDGAAAFVGPVFTYYEVDPHAIKRYSDQDWEAMLRAGTQPARPAWTESFRAQ
ncbi:MAG: hypothetical protein CVU56_25295 [Deltaproteobacteria bacterium HGW-Deltaproteobacteria-14]|jgi:hypothetical protein|nr:MAG: hypothetical protein CVU56_25295 [Deltaproteobacteria bacterium HGW-Deltaproteobacteria-14]